MGSNSLPIGSIDQVSLLTGGIPAKYGDATGGIVEITTRGYKGSNNNGTRTIQGSPSIERRRIASSRMVTYYRAREFPKMRFNKGKKGKENQILETTVHWEGHIRTDELGEAVIEFSNTDQISSFRVTAEGISQNGQPGMATHNHSIHKGDR